MAERGDLHPADSSSLLTLAVTSSTGSVGMALGLVQPSTDLRSEVDVLGVRELATDRRHAEELSPGLKGLLDDSGRKFSDVQMLVVDVGPGRFTGLRVGLATVKALSFALDIPVVGLTSLEILAGTDPVGDHTSVIDARREEVFQQVFVDGVTFGDAHVGSATALASTAKGRIVGDGADRYADAYASNTNGTVIHGCNPDAATMLSLSGRHPGKPGAEVQPVYLRSPDANPNIKTRPTASSSREPIGE